MSKFLMQIKKSSPKNSKKQENLIDAMKKQFFDMKNNLDEIFHNKCSCELIKIN